MKINHCQSWEKTLLDLVIFGSMYSRVYSYERVGEGGGANLTPQKKLR